MTFLLIWVRRHCGVCFPTHLQILLSFPVQKNSKSHPSIPHQHNPSISTLTHTSSPPPARSSQSRCEPIYRAPTPIALASTATHLFVGRSIPPSACSILLEKQLKAHPASATNLAVISMFTCPLRQPPGSGWTEHGWVRGEVSDAAAFELDPP